MIPRRLRVAALGAACTASLMLCGCNIATPILFAIEGPPKVEAVHTLDPDRSTVIFVEDRSNRMPRRSLRGTVGKTAEQALLAKKRIDDGKLISSASALRVAGEGTYSEPMPVVDVGRRLEAEVVIWVEVVSWTLSADGTGIKARAQATVKIVDALKNERIWPPQGGYPVTADVERLAGTTNLSRSERHKLEEQLATMLGLRVAELFYTHERESLRNQRAQP